MGKGAGQAPAGRGYLSGALPSDPRPPLGYTASTEWGAMRRSCAYYRRAVKSARRAKARSQSPSTTSEVLPLDLIGDPSTKPQHRPCMRFKAIRTISERFDNPPPSPYINQSRAGLRLPPEAGTHAAPATSITTPSPFESHPCHTGGEKRHDPRKVM